MGLGLRKTTNKAFVGYIRSVKTTSGSDRKRGA